MSVRHYQDLLREARAELESYVRLTKSGVPPLKTIQALQYAYVKLVNKINETLEKDRSRLGWRSSEPGAWHSKFRGYDLSIYKDAGAYYWQASCADASAPESLEKAQSEVESLVGAGSN